MIWDENISFEGLRKIHNDWFAGKDFELCNPPVNAQFALNLIFKTLVDDKKHIPYLTTMPESTEQTNNIMLHMILWKYSRKYRKYVRKLRKNALKNRRNK